MRSWIMRVRPSAFERHGRRPLLVSACLSVAVSIGLVACASSGSSSPQGSGAASTAAQTIPITIQNYAPSIPLNSDTYVSQMMVRYSQQFFAGSGLQPTFQPLSISGFIPVVASSRGTVFLGSGLNDIVSLVGKNEPLIDVNVGSLGSSFALMVNKSITSVSDLRGKTIGVPDPVSAGAAQLYAALAKLGLPKGSYQVATVGSGTSAITAALRGSIAGFVLAPPVTVIAQQQGLTELMQLKSYVPTFVSSLDLVNTNWAASNHEALVRLLEVTIRTTDYLVDPANKAKVLQLIQNYIPTSPLSQAQTLDFYNEFSNSTFLPVTASASPAQFTTTLNILQLADAISDADVAQSKFLDWSYLKDALRALGMTVPSYLS